MKNYKSYLSLLAVVFAMSCKTADNKTDDSNNIPTDIEQKGVLGSWTHSGTDTPPLVLSVDWYIQPNVTTVVNVCDFGDRNVTAAVKVTSIIQGSILTFHDSATRQITDGSKICSVSVTANSSYALSLTTTNALQVTRGGVITNFTRMAPVQQ